MELPSIVPPPHGEPWPEAPADLAGMNWMWLEEAARFATENETPWPYDLRLHLESGFFEPPPLNEILGPIRPRGPANGLVLRRGFKIASWGETDQVDFPFSAAKSYLSLLAGIAVMDGLITDLDDPVGRPGQSAESGFAPPLPPRAAGGVRRTDHGPDWHVVRLVVARLQHLDSPGR